MRFVKMHGLGNDFILVERADLTGEIDLEGLALRLCNRHFGIGADGLIIVDRSDWADVKMRIYNADGSEAEMCGNGVRCFAKYVYEKGIVEKNPINVETLAGIVVLQLEMEKERVTGVCVDMGEPRLDRREIPMLGEAGPVIGEPLTVGKRQFSITAVSMGNPHCVIFTDNLEVEDLSELGKEIENHPLFPKKTNVEFAQILNPREIVMKVWERGVGETLACGTGACAVAVAANLNGLTERSVIVSLPGGKLNINWNERDNHVYMTGPAEKVFEGVYINE